MVEPIGQSVKSSKEEFTELKGDKEMKYIDEKLLKYIPKKMQKYLVWLEKSWMEKEILFKGGDKI